MTVTCLLSQTGNDLFCPVCGQGVRIFAEHATATVREQVKRRVQRAMRNHHSGTNGGLNVHPAESFPVEEGNTGVADWIAGWLPSSGAIPAMAF